MSLEIEKFVTLIYEKYKLGQNNGDSPIRNAVILKNHNVAPQHLNIRILSLTQQSLIRLCIHLLFQM